MNIITTDIEKLVIDRLGEDFDTDFRTSILFELMMQDKDLSQNTKIIHAIKIFYPNTWEKIKDIKEAINGILWFYSGNIRDVRMVKAKKSRKIIRPKSDKAQIYNFEFDSDYIYSAFWEQYKIDLQDIEYLHWWKFKALFQGLNKNTKIMEIMEYRSIDLSKIKDKEEKKRYKKLKEIYSLPDMRTQEEKEDDFNNQFI